MVENPLISVVIPCFNASEFINEAIDSIINQTYSNLEIICIDDGSVDNTLEILRDFERKDNRVKVLVNESNLGLIRSLNKGVQVSNGEFIARMDADDISVPFRLKKLLEEFKKNPELEAVSASACYITLKGKNKGCINIKGSLPGALKFISFFSTPVVHACILIKKKLLIENLYDIDYIHSEDYEIFSRLILKGHHFKNIPDQLYLIRINPKGVSRKYETIQIATHTRISERNLRQYFGYVPEYFIHKIIMNRISFLVTPKMINNGFSQLDDLKRIYLSKETISAAELIEIIDYIREQKIDIFLQSIKYTKFPQKILIIGLLMSNINLFLSKKGWKYFKAKLVSRYG